MASDHVVIVGASMSGLRSAEQLRSAGHTGAITVIGEEPHAPYNRPPLSKEVLADPGDHSTERLHDFVAFRRRRSTADVEYRLGRRAEALDLSCRTVSLDDGSSLSFDGLVLATGLRPRRLTIPGPNRGRHVLRSLEHCIALRRDIQPGGRAVVIGAGFIGCEVAATLTGAGMHVTVVDPLGPPLVHVTGRKLAKAVRRHHQAAGIAFAEKGVTAITGEERVTGVVLEDGAHLPADVVIEAVGAVPNTEWLDRSGLDLSDGVLTDNHLLALLHPGARAHVPVVAVGDIARFPNPLFDDEPRRVEHWSIPTDTAKRAARSLVHLLSGTALDDTPFAPVPSFWSDQFDLRLQSYGSPALGDTSTVDEGTLDDLAAGVLVTYTREGRHIGSIAVNLQPSRHRGLRDLVSDLAIPH